MNKTPIRTVFGEITDFLTSDPSVAAILTYQLPDDLQARVDYLIERNGEGLLTFEEQQELYDFMRADDMMSLLKVKTQLKLRKSSHHSQP